MTFDDVTKPEISNCKMHLNNSVDGRVNTHTRVRPGTRARAVA